MLEFSLNTIRHIFTSIFHIKGMKPPNVHVDVYREHRGSAIITWYDIILTYDNLGWSDYIKELGDLLVNWLGENFPVKIEVINNKISIKLELRDFEIGEIIEKWVMMKSEEIR